MRIIVCSLALYVVSSSIKNRLPSVDELRYFSTLGVHKYVHADNALFLLYLVCRHIVCLVKTCRGTEVAAGQMVDIVALSDHHQLALLRMKQEY